MWRRASDFHVTAAQTACARKQERRALLFPDVEPVDEAVAGEAPPLGDRKKSKNCVLLKVVLLQELK